MNSIFEAVNGAWEILFWNHEWIPHISIVLQECDVAEASHYDTDVPCIVQWGLWWYSAPTSFDNDLLNDGVILEQYIKLVVMAI